MWSSSSLGLRLTYNSIKFKTLAFVEFVKLRLTGGSLNILDLAKGIQRGFP